LKKLQEYTKGLLNFSLFGHLLNMTHYYVPLLKEASVLKKHRD